MEKKSIKKKLEVLQYYISILVISLGFCLNVESQDRICGNDSLLIFKNYLLKDGIRYGKKLENTLQNRSQKVVNVVFHIVWSEPSENINIDLVFSQLKVLNTIFSNESFNLNKVPEEFRSVLGNPNIGFCLADEDPTGNFTSGVNRVKTEVRNIGISEKLFFSDQGGSEAWDPDKYLNIWIANTGTLISGYGSYPNQTMMYRDGVVIHPKYFGQTNIGKYGKGLTLVHELGHYFGLYHLWGADSNCASDDEVEDTPTQLRSYTGCPTYPQAGCSLSEMFMNYMDYVDDECMHFFTKGQSDRMNFFLDRFRSNIVKSGTHCNVLLSSSPSILIYPNPSNALFKIDASSGFDANIAIFSLLGKKLDPILTVEVNTINIDLSKYPSGIYLLKYRDRIEKLLKVE